MLRFLLEKEFKQMVRNPILPRIIIMFPIVMMLIMPLAMNMEVKGVRVAVVDMDNSTTSNSLIQKIGATEYFTLSSSVFSYQEALYELELDRVDAILEIPHNFSKNLLTQGLGEVQVSVNSVNGVKGGMGANYLSSLIGQFGQEYSRDLGSSQTQNIGIKVEPKFYYNTFQRYELYMVPALMVMILTLLCGFMPALNIVAEKELGTIEQINVSPVGRFMFIFSKMLPYWIVGLMAFSTSWVVAYWVWDIYPHGSMLEVYIVAIIYIIVISGLGLVVSNYSETVQQGMFVMFFFVILFILMSGLFTPVSSMPDWAQSITVINPLKYFIELIRGIVIRGASIVDMLPSMASLIIYATVASVWAILSYKKTS